MKKRKNQIKRGIILVGIFNLFILTSINAQKLNRVSGENWSLIPGKSVSMQTKIIQQESVTEKAPVIPGYMVSTSSTEGGRITPEGDSLVDAGGTIAFTIIPDEDYKIRNVTVNGIPAGAVSSLELTDVNQDYEVKAYFLKLGEKELYTIWGEDPSQIYSTRLNGMDSILLYTMEDGCYDMEVDFYNETIYFGHRNVGIMKMRTDGTGVDTLITVDSAGVGWGLGLDIANKKLYYFSAGNAGIFSANLDGSDVQKIVEHPEITDFFECILAIQVNYSIDKLFWLEYGSGTLICSGLDGSNVDTLVTLPASPGFTINEITNTIYIAQMPYITGMYGIYKANLDGSNLELLVDDRISFAMACDNANNQMFFGDLSFMEGIPVLPGIYTLDFETNDIEMVFLSGDNYIIGIAIPVTPPDPSMMEDHSYIFKEIDFFSPAIDFGEFENIKIITGVDQGILFNDLNDNMIPDEGEELGVGDILTLAEITARQLIFKPDTNEFGLPYTSFDFKWYNGSIYSDITYIKYIFVSPVDDSPIISNIEEDFAYYQAGSAVGTSLTSTLRIEDVDNDTIVKAKVSIAEGYQAGEDTLYYDGDKVLAEDWDELTGTLILSGEHALADYDTILSHVVYKNLSAIPNEDPRLLSVLVFNTDSSNILSRTLHVGTKYYQNIDFGPFGTITYGDNDTALPEVSSLDLPVSYESSDTTVAKLNGYMLQFLTAGTSAIHATQAGNDTVIMAEVERELIVIKANLSVTAENNSKVYGEENPEFTLLFTGWVRMDNPDSIDELPDISCEAIASTNAGTVPIELSGGSDNNYAFVLVNGSLTITKAGQTITFGTLDAVSENSGPFALSASVTSGLPIGYSSSDILVATIEGATVTVAGAGSTTITAMQAGDVNYEPAADVSQLLEVTPVSGLSATNYSELKVFPVPAYDWLTLNVGKEIIESIQIIGITGIKVMDMKVHKASVVELEVSELNPGLYLLVVKTNSGLLYQKISIE